MMTTYNEPTEFPIFGMKQETVLEIVATHECEFIFLLYLVKRESSPFSFSFLFPFSMNIISW